MLKNKFKKDVAEVSLKNKHVGPIIGALIVFIIIVVIGLYILISHINLQSISNSEKANMTPNGPDDVQALKNDLNNAIK